MTTDWPSWLPPLNPPYLVIDSESTGIIAGVNRTVMVGYGLVQDLQFTEQQVVDAYVHCPYDSKIWGAIYHNKDYSDLAEANGFWTYEMVAEVDARYGSCLGCPSVPTFAQNLMNKSGSRRKFTVAVDVTGITPPMTLERGHPPEKVFKALHELLWACYQDQVPIVGHNLVQFDIPFLQAEFIRLGFGEVPIDTERLIDTGLIVKALQLGYAPRSWENRLKFYRYIGSCKRRIKWSLDSYCVPRWNLDAWGVDVLKQHKSAGYDCFVTHCLVQAMQKPVLQTPTCEVNA